MTEDFGNIPDGFFLSEKEVEELHKSKKELTEYGKKKFQELVKKGLLQYNDALTELKDD